MEEEPLQLDRPGCEDELIARLFPGISLKPRRSWRLGSWSGRSERGAEPKAGKSRGTLYPRSWAPSSVLLPSQPGGTDATGNWWQMTVNRRQTVDPQQRQATPHRQTCQEGAPRSRGKLACCGVWEMSLVCGDRCWKMGGIQKCRRDWEITRGRCVLQTAGPSTAAPLCPKRLSEAQTTLWKWPKENHGIQLRAGKGCYCLSSEPGTCPHIHPTPTRTH